jgi:uncharacterized metal-binding protein YceD (DUF177 family)
MADQEPLSDIKPIIKLNAYGFDETTEYVLNEDCTWVAALFNELEEEVDREEPDYSKGFISLDLTVKRKSAKPFGDHLLVAGNFNAKYFAPCIRCLKLTQQELSAEFRSGYIHGRNEKEPEFEELDDIFADNEEWSLYFYDKGQADIAEMAHEHLFINIEHFPLYDENCKGLCLECGHDLNDSPCPKHGPKA